MNKIYLDNNATTQVDPRVAEVVYQELTASPSNPSSVHFFGQKAKKRLLRARETVASFFSLKPQEVIFTSGATESLNLLLRGIRAEHIVSSDLEHSCVYDTLKDLEKMGTRVTYLATGPYGAVTREQVESHLRPNTGLLVLGAANSETGVKNPIELLAEIALSRGIPFVVDGVAALGKDSFVFHPGITAAGFSGHKFHAPQGVGFALIRSSLKLSPLCTGGGQEYGKRSGTENLPGIVGLAKALELLSQELPERTQRMQSLRDHFEKRLQASLEDVEINGEGARVANTSNLSFLGVDGETLLLHLDQGGVAASHGSACASGALEPSRVLTHMGLAKERVRSAVRFSLSHLTTLEEINRTVELLLSLIPRLRGSD